MISRDLAIVEAYQKGEYTLQEIGQVWELTRERVRQILNKNGVATSLPRKSRERQQIEQANKRYVRDMVAAGADTRTIAAEMGLGRQAVVRLRRKAGVPGKQGGDCRAKDAETIAQMRRSFVETPAPLLHIARDFGVSLMTAYRHTRGLSRKVPALDLRKAKKRERG